MRRAAMGRAPGARCHSRCLAGVVLLVVLGVSLGLAGCGTSRTHGEIYFADGLERLALGDSAGALDLFERANYELGGDARVLVHIGRLQAASGTLEGRARARQTLDEARQRDPDGAVARAALGELLREQRYQRASTRALAEALRLDPLQPRTWLLLGHNLSEEYFAHMEETPLLDSAAVCYQRAYDLDSTQAEARYRLAFLHMHHGRHETARALVLPVARGDCPGRFGLLLAAIDYHMRRFEEAQERLDATLACMTPSERETWLGLAPLLHPDSVGTYRVRSEAGRDSLLHDYWWEQDPTPASLTNERVVEHVCRAVEADFYFTVPWRELPGRQSDRGEIYLRYGPPALVRRNAEFRLPTFEWRYRTRGVYDTVFFFVDWSLNGNYIRLRRTVASDFIEPSALEAQPTQTSVVFQAPPGGWKRVVRQFRGDQGRTALEIAYEFGSLDDVVGLNVEAAAWRGPGDVNRRLRTSVKVGSLYRVDERRIGRLRFEVRPEVASLGLELAGLERHGPAVGSDSAATPLRIAWRARGRERIELQRFDPERLMLSDIMLAHEVRNGQGNLFDMGGVIAVPRVDDRITESVLHLYFEAYVPERIVREQTGIAVRYTVRALPPRTWSFWDQLRPDFQRRMDAAEKPAVEATFTFLPAADLERQQLSIDLDTLQPGPYELHIELVDTVTGASTSRSVEFDYAAASGLGADAASAETR